MNSFRLSPGMLGRSAMSKAGAGLVLLAITLGATSGHAQEVSEPPLLADAVAAGDLPPLIERIPDVPQVVDFAAKGQTIGRNGGDLRMLMAKSKDTRQITVYGYARLVKYNQDLELVPDILADVDVEDGRTFTLHLRPGHKWSDGHPFTSDDFRYWWEDIVHNEELYPSGPPAYMKIGGEYPEVTFPDAHTVRYSWDLPNPDFLPSLAQASPRYIYAPAHYLKQFHPRYTDPEKLAALAEERGQRGWASIHTRLGRLYRAENPDLPTLQPWIQTIHPPAERFVYVRNPYYHKIDAEGRQLPYMDRVIFSISEKKLIPGKAATGDIDLQGRYLRFDDFTLLKQREKQQGYQAHLWRIAKGAHLALYPNMTHSDPLWRQLFRDVRFRRALSLAINRYEINRVVYYGLALEGQNTLLPGSPLYEPTYREQWAGFDLDEANRILDEIGLPRARLGGTRELPNGEPLDIIVETSGLSTEETDVLQLIKDTWRDVGINLFIKPLSRENMSRRVFAGQTQMAIFSGLENGLATADMVPDGLAPVHQTQYQWSNWGQYAETNGTAGEPPDTEVAKRLMALYEQWFLSRSDTERREIWAEMLKIHSDNVFTIGLIAGVLQPIIVKDGLMNVPEEGIWNWDPGAHFGLYGMDGFYWRDGAGNQTASAGTSG